MSDEVHPALEEQAAATPEAAPVQQPPPEGTEQPQELPAFTRRLLEASEQKSAELARLREENQRLRTGAMSGAHPADVDAIRAQVAAEAQAQAALQAFNTACNATYNAGVKEYGREAFDGSVGTMRAAFQPQLLQRRDILEVINETEHGHRVYHALAKDLDAMAELCALPPHKAALRIAKMSAELGKAGTIRAASRLPPPINPIAPSTRSEGNINDPRISMEEYARLRDKQVAERRGRR